MQRLEEEVRRLEEIRREQAAALSHAQQTAGSAAQTHDRKHEKASNTISALTSELRTTKQALEDVTTRERQVSDDAIRTNVLGRTG